MFWTRLLGQIPPGLNLENYACIGHLDKILNIFEFGSIIIGHTPQAFYNNDINSTCSNKVWRIDSGASKAFNTHDKHYKSTGSVQYNRRLQYLEILNDNDFKICDEKGCINELKKKQNYN